MNDLLLKSTYDLVNTTLEKWQFNLNKGKKAFIWCFNIDTETARRVLHDKGYKTRVRYKLFLKKNTNLKGLMSYSFELRKRVWFTFKKSKW